ncbi:MAG: hypothetical protein N3F03_02955 [Ignavibacteria bacterium]|nr:hypothetical protein [Ignavibacteria bacterium]
MNKKFFVALITLILLVNIANAQWGLLRRIGLDGGVHFGVVNPSLHDLNNEFKKFDLPEMKNPIFVFGGGGGISIGGIRVGGLGYGGSTEEEKIRTIYGTSYNTKVKMEYGVGYGIIGYEVYHSKKFSANFDLGIGGGDINLLISDRTSDFNLWDETLVIPVGINNITRKITYSFFSLQPSLTFEYIYGNFLKFLISGGYNFIISDDWSKDDDLELIKVPKMNFNGFTIRMGIYTGLFF